MTICHKTYVDLLHRQVDLSKTSARSGAIERSTENIYKVYKIVKDTVEKENLIICDRMRSGHFVLERSLKISFENC